jgi:adenylate cyclase
MQDGYGVPIDKREQMYGVEIHANILKAMLDQSTAVPVNNAVYALAVALLAVLFFVLIDKMKIIGATVSLVLLSAVCIAVPKILFQNGIEIALIYPILFIILIYAVKLVYGYVLETVKKRKILNAFKKYVAPEVVNEIASKGDFSLKLGGENRHIAVLFVDIRGFTPLSEGLEPQVVVEILNEYLNLTTNAIFKNKGTLDKFVGDCTMAFWNTRSIDSHLNTVVRYCSNRVTRTRII